MNSGTHSDGASGDILARIRDAEPEMSRSQRKIAQAILRAPHTFAEKPIEDLAPWIGVSAPTITRFCRLVHCNGLRELKLRIMGSMRVGSRYLAPTDPPRTAEGVRAELLARAQSALIAADHQLPPEAVERALDALLSGGVIYAFGSGGVSSWLVDEIQNRLFRIGLRVVPCRDGTMATMFAATLGRGDVVLCVSLGGENGPLLTAARVGREYGATTIAITAPGSSLAEGVDILLPCRVPDNGDVLGPTSSRYGFLFVIDVLAFAAAIRIRPRAMETLRRLKQQFVSEIDGELDRPLAD
ncbi:MAG: MurR/RpiR family transcriptional regulator [Amaricoccus sp.]|uniref:MurR/RpiR family transcriptional regulator n=1 Tax=Amaricoccus sp. TaxID=1872485 RepID=UPI0039E45211